MVPPNHAALSPEAVVRSIFEAQERRDYRSVLARLHPHVEWTTLSDGNTYRGVDEVQAFLRREEHGGPRLDVSLRQALTVGDSVVVRGRIRTIDHGRIVDSPACWTFTVRDGLVTRVTPAHS